MKTNRTLFILILLLNTFINSFSQQVDKGFELHELMKIAQVYRHIPSLSFDMEYSYADSAKPNKVLETVTGTSKIKDGLSWCMLDSVEMVQGQTYSLAVYYEDSIISLSARRQHATTFQLPLLDSLFRAANVESLSIMARNDSLRTLTVTFQPTSVYSRYRLYYNAYTYLIDKMEYYTREVPGEEGHSGTGLIGIRLYNYSFLPVQSELFREDRFVQKTNGTFKATAAFADFRLMINTDK